MNSEDLASGSAEQLLERDDGMHEECLASNSIAGMPHPPPVADVYISAQRETTQDHVLRGLCEDESALMMKILQERIDIHYRPDSKRSYNALYEGCDIRSPSFPSNAEASGQSCAGRKAFACSDEKKATEVGAFAIGRSQVNAALLSTDWANSSDIRADDTPDALAIAAEVAPETLDSERSITEQLRAQIIQEAIENGTLGSINRGSTEELIVEAVAVPLSGKDDDERKQRINNVVISAAFALPAFLIGILVGRELHRFR